jgi:hypothetical protein
MNRHAHLLVRGSIFSRNRAADEYSITVLPSGKYFNSHRKGMGKPSVTVTQRTLFVPIMIQQGTALVLMERSSMQGVTRLIRMVIAVDSTSKQRVNAESF